MAGQTQSLASDLLGDTSDLKHNTLGLHHGNPVLRRTFTGTHSGVGGTHGHGLVGEDLDPDLTATLGVTSHGDTGGLDLVALDPAGFQSHQTILTVRNGVATGGFTSHAAPLHTAELDSLRH